MDDPPRRSGVDINESIVSSLKEKGLNCFHGSVNNLSTYLVNKFEIIYMRNIIEHMTPYELAECLEGLPDLCVENANIIIITPCESKIWSTASHIRPYPPISIHKLLTSPTETYLFSSSNAPPLSLLSAYTTYNVFNCTPINVVTNLLFNSVLKPLQFLLPGKFRSHYLMVLAPQL